MRFEAVALPGLFGLPPVRDMKAAMGKAQEAA